MFTDVYADVLFLINFSMDAISLYISARLCAARISAKRIAAGAVIGGVYSVLSLLLGLEVYFEIAVFLLVCVIMCSVALSPDGVMSTLKYSAVMFVASSLIGGVMTASYGALSTLLSGYLDDGEIIKISPLLFSLLASLSMAAALFLCSLHGSGNMPDKCEMEITLLGKVIKTHGIFDSGNMLSDPLSGRAVIIVERKVLSGVLSDVFISGAVCGESIGVFRLPTKEKKLFRLVPMKSVGGSTYLWGVICDNIKITYQKKGKTKSIVRDAVVALSDASVMGTEVKSIVPQSII